VSELFHKMRESRKEILHKQTGQGLQKTRSGQGLETILTYSNQYEVMYVGSIRMSQKRAHPQVIDEAISRFKQLDRERQSLTDVRDSTGANADPQTCLNRQNLSTTPTESQNIPDSTQTTHEINTTTTTITNTGANQTVEHTVSQPTTRRFLVKVIEEGSECRSPSSTGVSPVPPPDSPTPQLPLTQAPASNSLLLPTTLIPNTQSLDAETRVSLLRELRDYQKSASCSPPTMDCPDSVFSPCKASPERKRSVSGD
ncbi:unnamed protein product, partial [Oppiella nova]